MKFISWNVNGIRACVQKGFLEFFKEEGIAVYTINSNTPEVSEVFEKLMLKK